MKPNRNGIIALVLLIFLVWLVAYPLVLVLVDGFRGPNGWTLEYARLFLRRHNEGQALWGSLWISLATVGLAAAIGVPLAYLFWRYDFPGRRILGAIVALPAVLPPLVGVIAFLFLYGESGFASPRMQWPAAAGRAPGVLGAGAMLLVHAYSMYVYFYLFTRAGLATLGRGSVRGGGAPGRWTLARPLRVDLAAAAAGRCGRRRCSRS